ncbi:iron complex outermembrane receptor protein [Altererythrobacter atlanticus]|uniref:Colicin I receptor n=1 Tax=Croceibacterium atlanticum TaxID=1267766 RepID=A0A0F7KPA2_9SPHN|nr:TonB-dependent receptor [Croceibacterium atlanticum]AKH41384.1 Colicin I receptor precursor [Croceibacterium atlanticum]MBB5732845.1 iron complex outermembrane receptor protein [Croceibacterium atlanticum]
MKLGDRIGVRSDRRMFGIAMMATVSMLTVASPVQGQTAQDAASSPREDGPSVETSIDTIVVTGTRIGGEAPVGAALVQLGEDDIRESGLASTADILNTVPSILKLGGGDNYAGGQAQQANTINSFSFNKSPNIRGLGVGATLSLVNGHRVPYEGGNMNAFDGDNFPAQMIQRIDVVQDGGSALYGADAIAGTVNYILRRPEDTLEVYSGYRKNDGQNAWYVTGIGGVEWAEGTGQRGGLIVSYQYSDQDPFEASARPDLYNDDLSPYGGPPSPLYSAPGNVVVGGNYYSIPFGQDGTDLTLSDLGTIPNRMNTWTGIEVIPAVEAHRVAANFEQNVTDWLRIFADGLYVHRDFAINGPNSSTSNRVMNFGQLPQIPNSNPYSPCNPDRYPGGVVTGPEELVLACQTGSIGVAYSTVYDIGPPMRTGTTETWTYGGGADVTLPSGWNLTISAHAGTHDAPSVTTQTGGAPAPDFATFNFFCDPTAFQCTDEATAASILARANNLVNRTKYEMQVYSATVDGPLFELPAGEVKVAIGFEQYEGSLLNQNNFGGNNFNPRSVSSAFGELFVPVVSPSADMPGIYELEFNISARYDDYSDAGSTTNPRFGVNWRPTPGLKIFGSWGTSFRAPGLADNDPFSQTGVIPITTSGTQIAASVCGACQSLPFGTIYQSIGGANRNLEPETSEAYAIGADWTPGSVPGLLVSAKYWHISYEGQISTPAFNVGSVNAINQQIYNSQIIYNPALFPELSQENPVAFFGEFPTIDTDNPACAAVFGQKVTTQALYDSMIACYNTGGETGGLFGPPTPPGNVLALVSGRRINAGKTIGDGFDINIAYSFDTDFGSWNLGAVGTYSLGWQVSPLPGAEFVEEVNQLGFPLTFQARGQLGWEDDFSIGRVFANAFVNFRNSYEIDRDQLPIGVDTSFAEVDAYTTFDLSIGLDTGEAIGSPLADGFQLTLSIQNLFDADPPLVVNQAGLAGTAVRFDPTYGSPLGRVFQVQVGKKF